MVKLPGLRVYRDRKALTQQELAEAAGLTRPNLARLEAGRQAAIPSTVRKLASALGVEPEDLMDAPLTTRRSSEEFGETVERANYQAINVAK